MTKHKKMPRAAVRRDISEIDGDRKRVTMETDDETIRRWRDGVERGWL